MLNYDGPSLINPFLNRFRPGNLYWMVLPLNSARTPQEWLNLVAKRLQVDEDFTGKVMLCAGEEYLSHAADLAFRVAANGDIGFMVTEYKSDSEIRNTPLKGYFHGIFRNLSREYAWIVEPRDMPEEHTLKVQVQKARYMSSDSYRYNVVTDASASTGNLSVNDYIRSMTEVRNEG